MTNWHKMISQVLENNGESWDDVESNTMSEEDMLEEFNDEYGSVNGCPFTIWTKKSVYFPVCYNGAEWVDHVSRNPDGRPTNHVGILMVG